MNATLTSHDSVGATDVVPAELSALLPFRDALTNALEERGWEPDQTTRVLTCAVEGMANAVEHGSPAGRCVALAFTVTGTRAEIRIADQGTGGRDCPSLDRQPPDTGQPDGRGLILIRGLADHAEIERRSSGTELRLAFRRDGHRELRWAA